MAPARAPRAGFQPERLLVIDPLSRRFGDYAIAELPKLLGRGDVLVVNDAATLPASLRVDEELELRLVAARSDGAFEAVTLGAGDYRIPTEQRGAPRQLGEGDRLRLGDDLAARVVHVDPAEPRYVRLRFESHGAALFSALYRHGRPIQYAYLAEPLALWEVQTRYASRPWSFEMPSAGRPLTFESLFELERRGAVVTYVTHAAGVSSTGSAALDARLPLPERFEIPEATVSAIARARGVGGRVIAAGTSVTRALEGRASDSGQLLAGTGETALRLGPSCEPCVVDGLLTGLHEPGTSHFELLEAFAPRPLLLRALEHAARTGYLQHELGDSCLILAGALLEGLAA
ncbi:MAG: S-adenosylmethionine tRNA ribosyltransferase [Myxococcales bacterium]|nr:MAG: S-adenosylmethionine tRNA ribosyltransferase [Myxococcales bacterium]